MLIKMHELENGVMAPMLCDEKGNVFPGQISTNLKSRTDDFQVMTVVLIAPKWFKPEV